MWPEPGGEKAVVLLSGGMDSATVLAMARREGYACYALSFDYGQHCRQELAAAARVAAALGVVKHLVVPVGLDRLGGSALTGDRPVPRAGEAVRTHGVPETYVPARNTVFIAVALGWAEVLGAHAVFIGANAVDYSGYPDCRPEYIEAWNRLARLAVAQGAAGGRQIEILAPLMRMSKSDIVRKGLELGVDYSPTMSCYEPDADGLACGRCDSCALRLKAFADAGLTDPAAYTGA